MAVATKVRAAYPDVYLSAGVSNVSFGLPGRKLLNETFLVLLMSRGLEANYVGTVEALSPAAVVVFAIVGKFKRLGVKILHKLKPVQDEHEGKLLLQNRRSSAKRLPET